MEPLRHVFTEAVLNAPHLPQIAKDKVSEATSIEEHEFDETYIQFLDEQIHLNTRGEEWSDRLRKRREKLLPFTNQALIRGKIPIPGGDISAEVDPTDVRLIHWEEYSCEEQSTRHE